MYLLEATKGQEITWQDAAIACALVFAAVGVFLAVVEWADTL